MLPNNSASGPMILKRHLSDRDPRATMGASLTVAALALTPFALLNPPQAMPSGEAIASLVVLGLLCTATAFVVFAGLVFEIGAGRAAVITYIAPVVALALGVAVLGDSPGTGAITGLLLILAGSWLSTDGRLPPSLERLASRIGRAPQQRREPARCSSLA